MIETSDRNNPLGEIKVSAEVLEVIVGIAALEVDGVYGMKTGFSSDLRTMLGKNEHSRGVALDADETGTAVDVYCYFKYGVNVPKVAREIQLNVQEQVYYMTEVKLDEVNVHIVGIVPDQTPAIDVLTAGDLGVADQ